MFELKTISGMSELNDALITMASDIQSKSELNAFKRMLRNAVEKSLQPVLASVIADAPYDEENLGPIHLRDTAKVTARIPTVNDKKSHFVNESDAVIGIVSVKKSAVSLSQEFGNAHTPPHPYLRVGLAKNADRVLGILKTELSTGIQDYAQAIAKKR